MTSSSLPTYCFNLKFLFALVCTRCAGQNDRISELPDDILTYVLSYLPMKDAGRTSILSKRWKHVWKYIPTLIFHSRNKIYKTKFVYWISQVISLHKAPILDEIRVRFRVISDGNSENLVDNWLRFAMEKKVKRFAVDFVYYDLYYLERSCNIIPQSSPCNSLTSLEFGSVNVTGEILESFLRNCLVLECLSVKYSRLLVELTVGGPLLKFKSLIIAHCDYMKKLEISAPSLVSACYIGPKIDVQFKSTPKLAQVSLGYYKYADNLIHRFSDLSSYLSQIEVLTLSPYASVEDIMLPTKDLVFPRLRKLDVTVFASANEKLVLFGFLMKACPFLLHFTLQLRVDVIHGDVREVESRVTRWTPCLHYHLKTLEIVGFNGEAIQMEIAVMLIKAAVVLDKITVDPDKYHNRGIPGRKRAEEIRPLLKPGTVFEIL